MANKYEAHHSDGSIYDVTTDHHHDDHTPDRFKQILAQVIQNSTSGAIGGIISGTVVHFVFKGRKLPNAHP
jgi:hypothetical protein